MKKNIVIAATLALFFSMPFSSFGQYAEQALRLSNLSYGGTARFTGVGGAFGAIGGDFTTMSTNPAGIGIYKNSEITFTPLVYNTRSFSEYFKNNQKEFSTRMNINNLGFVFAAPIINSDFKVIQFGIGCNRLANFNNNIYFEGYNARNSFLRTLSDDATNADRAHAYNINNPYYADELAGATNLLYKEGDEWFADKNKNVSQNAWLQREGGIDELVFTLGGNYGNKLYIGATLGFQFMSYWHLYQYEEGDPTGLENFRSMHYDETYKSEGSGINGKFGVIYKPVPFLRIGAALHTPTYYWLIQESEWMSMSSSFRDSIQWNAKASTQERQFEYSQMTPMRAIGSLAFTAGKIAVISADYEWVDHRMNTLYLNRERLTNNDNTVINNANTDIRNSYKNQHIVRTGVEIHLNAFYIRSGYGWYSSPFKNKNINNMSFQTFAFGAGFRAGAFGLDFAYQYARNKSKYYPYEADKYGWYNNDPSPYAKITDNANSFMLTFSYRY